MVDVEMPHDLVGITVRSKSNASYICRCGVQGSATMATHLGSYSGITKAAVTNHELHATRKYVKLLKEGKLNDSV